MQHGWKKLIVIVAAVALTPFVGRAETPQRTHDITVDDYLSVHLITDCATSPDGKHVAFAELRWGDTDKPRSTDLWVVDTATRRPTRLTFDPVDDHSPQWSPDGRRLYFITKRERADEDRPYDGTNQVWVITTHPGEPFPVTRVEGGIESYRISKDGRTLYYTRTGEEAEQEWKELLAKYSDIKFGDGPIEYTELWKLNLETWREEKLVAEERVISEFSVSDDESRIAMITKPDARPISGEGWSRVDVYDVKTEQISTLPDKLFREDAPSPYGWLDNLAWSSDGRLLAWTVTFDGYPVELLVADLGGDKPSVHMLKRPSEVTVTGHLHWIPGTADLCYLAEDHARRRIYCAVDVKSGKQAGSRILTPGDVVIHGYGFTADGKKLAVIKSDTQHCRDVFWLNPSQPDAEWTRLTSINPQMDTWKLPQISLVTWKAPDGVEVEGILELPPDYKSDDGPLPTVVEIHGGPTACTLYHLRYWIYGRTILAAKGYALLSPNYRGSTGYGDKFMTDLIGRENDIEVKDILAGVDAMVERGVADPDRLGVMGWSNGGYLTNCLITTTQRFKAASTGAGKLHEYTQWGLCATPGHVINYMRGQPWERVETYQRASPGWKIDRITTPTLIHTGEHDPNVVTAHSLMLYRGLKEYTDVPTVLLTYPGAGHGLRVSDHRKGKLDWDIAWFDRYLLGKTDDDPPAQK